jgi:hypothetical protein
MPLCASARRTSPFLILKKGRSLGHFVVKAWGLPRRGKPEGAVKVLYGPDQLSFGELSPSSKGKPTKKFLFVPIAETAKGSVPSKKEREVKKILLRLKPWNYFEASSNPKLRLDARAVLQSVKPTLLCVKCVLDESLTEIRRGDRSFGFKALHRIRQCLVRQNMWTLRDHILNRYTRWAIGVVKSALRVLRALGITCQDLRNPLLKNYGKQAYGSHRPARLFVCDKEYTTGDNMSPQIAGLPALTSIPSGWSSKGPKTFVPKEHPERIKR